MNGETSVHLIPDYVSAKSPTGLRRACLINNGKFGIQFHYFSIQFTQGRWYAWFMRDLSREDFVTNEKATLKNGGAE